QVSRNTSDPVAGNLVGALGAWGAYHAFALLGLSAWLVPVFLLRAAWLALRFPRGLTYWRAIAMLLALLSGAALASMLGLPCDKQTHIRGPGGFLGEILFNHGARGAPSGLMGAPLGAFGSALILGLLYLACLVFIFTRDLSAECDKLLARLRERWAERKRIRAGEAALKRAAKEAAALQKQQQQSRDDALKQAAANAARQAADAARREAAPPARQQPAAAGNPPPPAREKKSPAPPPAEPGGLKIVRPEETKKADPKSAPKPAEADYIFPTPALLKELPRPDAADSEEEHRQNVESLLRIFGDFGISVEPGEIHVGPTITRYEVKPARGTPVSKIAAQEQNIALGMAAHSVRILAPIPGKPAVGIELPNKNPAPVGMRELVESQDWANAVARCAIPIALGRDIAGKIIISDLAKMPHLLIAGATGSGKSVCINSILASILYSKSPKNLRLVMVDPKVVELQVYNPLPHMLLPVLTEPKKVPGALKWLLSEMEQRYQIFAKTRVRNITGFNNRAQNPGNFPSQPDPAADLLDSGPDIEIPDKLPYIVAIIDEIGDLMMIAKKEVEGSIARLAQLARAAGIHLIIATQRPSVNVITGLIKANFPSRIAFQVTSRVDSMTILDGKGAESLIGKGDMLFTPPGTSHLVRAQGAFVSDAEVEAIVSFLKQNGPPQYDASVIEKIEAAAAEDDEDADDDTDYGDLSDEQLMRKIHSVMRDTGKTSVSFMQRKLGLGYNRTAKLLDIMEDRGYISPDSGNGKRDILKDYPPETNEE
ncbi:MAG: DNA translocase FtsK, partial [Opitutaceae bacterium]|nr:DNA translocase FtsK [Opitutaceae bacterium]